MMSIKELREITGLSQSQFAERFYLKVDTVRTWEQGRRQCPDYIIKLIQRIMELEMERE